MGKLKSSSYYYRKAVACRELGRWAAADQWARLAARARRVARLVHERRVVS